MHLVSVNKTWTKILYMEVLRKLKSRLSNNHVAKGTIVLSAGGVVAGLISALSTPIYTRLYTPEQLGYGAFFLALTMCILPLTTFRMEYALVEEKNDADVGAIFLFSTFLSLIVSTLCLVLAMSFPENLLTSLPSQAMLLVPLFLIPLSFINCSTFLYTRRMKYELIGKNQIFQALCRSISIVFLAKVSTTYGMIFGCLGAVWLTSMLVIKQITYNNFLRLSLPISLNMFRRIFLRYQLLMKHSLSTSFLNGLAVNLMPVIFTMIYSPQAAGMIFVMQQLISMPAQLVSQAFWRTMFLNLSRIDDEFVRAETVRKIYGISIPLMLIPLVMFISLSDWVIYIIGGQWIEIIKILPYFAVMVFFNTLSNITSYFVSFKKFRAESLSNVSIFVIRLSMIIVFPIFMDDMIDCIKYYLIISSIVYMMINLYWAITLGFTKNLLKNKIFIVLPVIVLSFLSTSHLDNMGILLFDFSITVILILLAVNRLYNKQWDPYG